MNRIQTLFQTKRKDILSIYFTAGYPAINDTVRIIRELNRINADIIEIGIPFSDPIADGPVIQASSQKALFNGMRITLLFDQLESIREITDKPLIFMGYLNPVLKYGMNRFLQKCKETGIDGLIIPDLPVEEYMDTYKSEFEKHDIYNIFLITPQTPDERIINLDSITKGFIYMVSTHATTGPIEAFGEEQISYFRRIKALNLKSPILVGFGISNKLTYDQACMYANGAIVGSTFVKYIGEDGSLQEKINKFRSLIKEGV